VVARRFPCSARTYERRPARPPLAQPNNTPIREAALSLADNESRVSSSAMRVDAILVSERVAPMPPAPTAAELERSGRAIVRRLLKRLAVKP
jgi:hypothetical protein